MTSCFEYCLWNIGTPIMWFTYQYQVWAPFARINGICLSFRLVFTRRFGILARSLTLPVCANFRYNLAIDVWCLLNTLATLNDIFFYLISMLSHVLANITGNRTIINIFSNLTKGSFCRDHTNCPATLFCDQTRHTPSGFWWGFSNACINNKITKKKVKIHLSKRSVSTIWAFLKKSHASVNIASIYPFGHLNVLLII